MTIHRLIASAIATAALAGTSHAFTIFGLGAGGQLYRFDSATPGTMTPVGSATVAGIVDIDFRGSNNTLYAIAGNGATSSINTSTGQLTALFSPSTSLGGTVTGFDFNPAADRMRIAVGGLNNFRMVPDNIAGMTPGTVVNGSAGDGVFAAPGGVTLLDVAYTNPFSGGTTAFYSVGSDANLYLHSGTPQFNTMTAVGPLGVALAGNVGFDIDSSGTGYLASGTNFYSVNLATGAATSLGTLGQSLTSIAVVPEPGTALLSGLSALALLRRRRA